MMLWRRRPEVPATPAAVSAFLDEDRPFDLGVFEDTTTRTVLPLSRLELRARVAGLHASVVVEQELVNARGTPLEVQYVFPLPALGATVNGEVDFDRRHRLMRTHTALHVLCGVIWNEWRVPVTGGNMEPLSARMDFEFDPVPEGFASRIEQLVNAELARDRPITVQFLPRDTAVHDADLIRTKVSLIPESVAEIRVVDIVGLDKQADGGTHVRSTAEVGRIRVTKLENKGQGNKRVRLEIVDA